MAQLGIILVVVTPFIGGQLVLVSLAPRMSAVSAYLANVFLGCVLTAIDYFQCGSGGCGKVWEGEDGDIANQFIFRILIWAIVGVGLTMETEYFGSRFFPYLNTRHFRIEAKRDTQ